eukprot:COSAG05_NODE_3168_length_2271_cov_1.024862_1_plen_179_part_00
MDTRLRDHYFDSKAHVLTHLRRQEPAQRRPAPRVYSVPSKPSGMIAAAGSASGNLSAAAADPAVRSVATSSSSKQLPAATRTSNSVRAAMSAPSVPQLCQRQAAASVSKAHLARVQKKRPREVAIDDESENARPKRARVNVVREGMIDITRPGISFATPKGGNARGFVLKQLDEIDDA